MHSEHKLQRSAYVSVFPSQINTVPNIQYLLQQFVLLQEYIKHFEWQTFKVHSFKQKFIPLQLKIGDFFSRFVEEFKLLQTQETGHKF